MAESLWVRPVMFGRRIYLYREVIWVLALREIQKRYVGTLAGFVWSIAHPLAMVLIYWLVFSYGLKVQPIEGVSFIVTFVCGLAPWLMFQEALTASTNVVVANPNLVKKIVFPTEILPVVSLVASMIGHAVVVGVVCCVVLVNGMPLSLYYLQFVYYTLGLAGFSLGLGWLFSAVNVFYRDLSQLVAVVLNMWFWLTPIVWPPAMVAERYRYLLRLNPIYYIVEGYRNCFIYGQPFWVQWKAALVFWAVCLVVLVVGAAMFRRLKPEFADVL